MLKKRAKKTKAENKQQKKNDASSSKSFVQARKALRKRLVGLDPEEAKRIRALSRKLTHKEVRILWKNYLLASLAHKPRKIFQLMAKRYEVSSGDLEIAVFLRTRRQKKPIQGKKKVN